MISTDVIVVGGGCIGLTQALALAEIGIKVVVVDAQAEQQALSGAPQLRVSAISAASEAIFRHLGVWELLDASRLQPYETMSVWEKDSFGNIAFDAAQVQQHRLGHIIENDNIRFALYQKLKMLENVTVLTEHQVKSIEHGEREILVTTSKNELLIGRLVVAADGANSFVRRTENLPITFQDYEHTAIVATVKTELPHDACARQCFTTDGPVAFLPLWDEHHCSLVWSCSPHQAEKRMAMDDAEFSKTLTATFDARVGLVEVISKRVSFPLTMRYARQWIGDRVVLCGDAAHTIHPLAGLGMNLGLGDAAALAQVIGDAREKNPDIDPGSVQTLRQYERWRKSEAQTYIAAMEGLKRLFGIDNPVIKLIRTTGLSLVNQLTPVKDDVIKQAMGMSGNLPKIAKLKS